MLQKLYADVEGVTSGQDGYIIAITDLHNLKTLQSGSKVIQGTGEAEFTLHYQALVMKPIKGEVVDCQVEKVGKLGFFCVLGPMQIFVSTHYTPEDFKFQPEANPPAFTSTHTGESIRRGSRIRLRIVGVRGEQSDFFAIGSIKGDYLGPMED